MRIILGNREEFDPLPLYHHFVRFKKLGRFWSGEKLILVGAQGRPKIFSVKSFRSYLIFDNFVSLFSMRNPK